MPIDNRAQALLSVPLITELQQAEALAAVKTFRDDNAWRMGVGQSKPGPNYAARILADPETGEKFLAVTRGAYSDFAGILEKRYGVDPAFWALKPVDRTRCTPAQQAIVELVRRLDESI